MRRTAGPGDRRPRPGGLDRARAESRTRRHLQRERPGAAFADLIAMSRAVAGHTGPVELVDPDWLAEQQVEEFMGPESVALWLHDPDWAGFSSRDTRGGQPEPG